MRLKNKIALVTGAASGIGKAIAMRLAKEGATVAVADLNIAGAADVVGEISRLGDRAVPLEMDVTDEHQVDNGVATVVGRFGRTQVIDTMIDNIVTGLRAILAARKEGREKREAQHRAWEELRERRKLAEMRSARETRRIEYFQGLLDTGSEIAELRRWLSQMQDVGDTSLPQVGRLMAWAKERLGALEEALLPDAIAADLDANRLFLKSTIWSTR